MIDSDQQLVQRAQQGDQRAFGTLVTKHRPMVTKRLRTMIRDSAEIEDIVQEALLRAYRALPKFRGDSAFSTWLCRIVINVAKTHQASFAQQPPTLSLSTFDSEEAGGFEEDADLQDSNTPENELANKQIIQTVSGTTSALPGDKSFNKTLARRKLLIKWCNLSYA